MNILFLERAFQSYLLVGTYYCMNTFWNDIFVNHFDFSVRVSNLLWCRLTHDHNIELLSHCVSPSGVVFLKCVTMDIGTAFQPIEDELRDTVVPYLFKGDIYHIPRRAVTGLTVNQSRIFSQNLLRPPETNGQHPVSVQDTSSQRSEGWTSFGQGIIPSWWDREGMISAGGMLRLRIWHWGRPGLPHPQRTPVRWDGSRGRGSGC